MNINDTDAFMVYRTDENGTSAFHPILGEDVKNMLRGFTYNSQKKIWTNESHTIEYQLEKIG